MYVAIDWKRRLFQVGNSHNPMSIIVKENEMKCYKFKVKLKEDTCLAVMPFFPLSKEHRITFSPKILTLYCALKKCYRCLRNTLQRAISRFEEIKPRHRFPIWVAIVFFASGIIAFPRTMQSHQTNAAAAAAAAANSNVTQNALYEQFRGAILKHPQTIKMMSEKSFEKRNKLLRIGNFWIAPMTPAMPEEKWYVSTTANNGFWLNTQNETSEVAAATQFLDPNEITNKQSNQNIYIKFCNKLLWYAVPQNALALVFFNESASGDVFFSVNSKIPDECGNPEVHHAH